MVKLSWEFKEDIPFRGLPINAEKAEEINDKLNYISNGQLGFLSLPNVFYYSEKILEDLIELKRSLTFTYNVKIKTINELIPIYKEWVKQLKNKEGE